MAIKGRPRRTGSTNTVLGSLRYGQKLGVPGFAKKYKIGASAIVAVENGNLATNHPLIERIAEAYGVGTDIIRSHAKGPELSKRHLAIVGALTGRTMKPRVTKPGKALVHVPRKALVTVERTYDVARPIAPKARKLMRSIVDRVNLAVLKDVNYLDLRAVPVAELAEMLGDYVHAKGITSSVVLTPRYAGIFDED